MSKPHFRLRLVAPAEQPAAPTTHAEKLAKAIAYLRSRGKYLLDAGTPSPRWGQPGMPKGSR